MHAVSTLLWSLFLFAPFADGWLGVSLADDERAVIAEVVPGSPAAKAGLAIGDVMLAVDDKATPTRESFVAAIRAQQAGNRVRIKLQRGDREQIVVVRLGERPDEGGAGAPEVAEPRARAGRPPAPTAEARRGAPAEAPQAGRGYLGLRVRESDRGVVIDDVLPDGPAAKAGLAAGQLLRTLGDKEVRSLTDLDQALGALRPGQRAKVGVAGADGAERSVEVTVGRRSGAEAAEEPEEVEAVELEVVPAEPPAPPPPAGAPQPRRPGQPGNRANADFERELAELRRELAELRRQLEELKRSERRGGGRE